MEQYLEAGKIVNTHGVRGVVKIESWCDTPSVLASLEAVYIREEGQMRPLRVTHASVMGNLVLASFEGCDTMEAAQKLKNRVVYSDREDIPIPAGGHFIADLIGLDVINADSGKKYGTLRDVIVGAGNDIYEIETGGETAYLPAVDEFVVEIDLGRGIFVRPIEGIFDEI